MVERTVLISGGGIAGPALAYWLHRHGLRPVVIERAPGLRPGGQSVDLRGAGREVARRMDLEDVIRAAGTGERGVAFVDETGRPRAAFDSEAFGGEGFTAELEILRGELARVLYESTRDDVEYLFGDRITAVEEGGSSVRVTLERGGEREADLLVGADGLRSGVRELVFGDEPWVHHLGLTAAYTTIPRVAGDGDWARWYNATGGRTLLLRPDNLGTTRALLTFLSPPRGDEWLPVERQKEMMRRVYADVGWQAPRVLAALDDVDEFYLESIGQVRMPTWTRGRTVLLGDAGYCPSPISGMGTTLALVGAYVLAGEIARHDDHRAVAAAYEATMRPYVASAQQLPPGAPRIAVPTTRLGIGLLHSALWLASTPPGVAMARRLMTARSEGVELPEYATA